MSAKKGKHDDASFEFGEELFPLDSSSGSGNSGKPPKGVKGYFKNVAKSVFNLTVKVNKQLYPSVFDLKENSTFNDNEGNKFDIKKAINKYTGMVKDFGTEVRDIGKDIANDAKQAVKTGYFVKTEDEEMDMGDAFGDLLGDDIGADFGGDDFGSDFGDDFGSDFDDDFGDTPKKKKGKLSTSDAIIRSEAASTRATLKASNRQIAATVGATQSHIKHETALFAQQLQIDQERHFQKMKVLKNIASNIATTVKQNNLAIQAQMEFSAKSLAFAQDTAAMVKEIRDAQWQLTKAEEKDLTIKDSKWKKIVGGSGVDIGGWLGHTKQNFEDNAFGGIISQLKMPIELLNSVSDMGIKKSTMIKQMVGDMLIESVVKGSLDAKTLKQIDRFNVGMKGLPSALNNLFGKWARGDTGGLESLLNQFKGTKVGGWLGKSKLGRTIFDKIPSLAETFGANAHIKEEIHYSSDRFKMGDPNKVHPFDNKAHKVLTEIIPSYLSKISAGVNHTEEQIFDYDLNRFVNKRAVKNELKADQESVLENLRGYDESRTEFENKLYSIKSKTINKEEIRKWYPRMYRNWIEAGHTWHKEEIDKALIKKKGDTYEDGPYTKDLFKNINCSSDHEKVVAVNIFVQQARAEIKRAKQDDDAAIEFMNKQVESASFKNTFTNQNLNSESDSFNKYGSLVYEEFAAEGEAKSKLSVANSELTKYVNLQKEVEEDIKKNGSDLIKRKKLEDYRTKVKELRKQITSIQKSQSKYVSDINSSNFANMESKMREGNGDFDTYRLASLEDSSTHGLVQNIYNLLLSGIDVFTTPKEFEPEERKRFLEGEIDPKTGGRRGGVKSFLAKKYSEKIESDKKVKFDSEYEKLHIPVEDYEIKEYPPGDPLAILKFNNLNGFNGRIYYFDNNNKLQSVNADKFIQGEYNKLGGMSRDWFLNIREINAFADKDYRRSIFEDSDGALLNKGPLKIFARMFNRVEKFKSKIGNTLLDPLYGLNSASGAVKDVLSQSQEARNEFNKFAEKQKIAINEAIGRSEEEKEKFKKDPVGYLKNIKKKGADWASLKASTLINSNDMLKSGADKVNEWKNNAKKKAGEFADSKVMNYVKERIDTKLVKLKPSKKIDSQYSNLAEAIGSIADPEFHKILNRFATERNPVSKARFLVTQADKHESLKPFVPALHEFINKNKNYENNQSSFLGYAVAAGKDFGKRMVDRLKNNILSRGMEKIKRFRHIRGLRQLFFKTVNIDGVDLPFIDAIDKYDSIHNLSAGELSMFDKIAALSAEEVANKLKPDESIKRIIDYLLQKVSEGTEEANKYLAPFAPALQEFEKKAQNVAKMSLLGTAKSIITKPVDFVLKKIKKFIFGDAFDPKKMLGHGLMNIEAPDGTRLGDEIAQIAKDNGFNNILKVMPTDLAKAKYLQSLKIDELAKYKPALGEFISNTGKGLLGFAKSRLGTAKNNVKNFAKGLKDKFTNRFRSGNNAENEDAANAGNMNAGNSSINEYYKEKLKDEKQKDKDDLVKGNSSSEMRQAKIDAAKEKREAATSEAMQSMAETMKNGLPLSKDTLANIGKIGAAGATGGAAAVAGMFNKFLDFTGLSKTKWGKTLRSGSGAVEMGGAYVAKEAFKHTKVGQKAVTRVGKWVGKIPGIGKFLEKHMTKDVTKIAAKQAEKAAAKAAKRAAKQAAKGTAGAAAKGAAKAGGKTGIISRIIDKVLNFGPIKKHIGKGAATTLRSTLMKALERHAPKLATRLTTISARFSTGLIPLIGWASYLIPIAYKFHAGMMDAKKMFMLGAGQRISNSMKICCGVASALDEATLGILGILANLCGKPNFPIWVYETIGSEGEKAAMDRYQRFNQLRAKIYGIENADALAVFENKETLVEAQGFLSTIFNGTANTAGIKDYFTGAALTKNIRAAGKVLRNIGSFFSFGKVNSTDDNDAKNLGFKSTKIFKYWKENKFKYLDQLRKAVADEMGVKLKDVDEMVEIDPTDIGSEDEDDNKRTWFGLGKSKREKAEEQMRKIEAQQEYRAKYLEAARRWVLDNHLAWLTVRCTPEEFEKWVNKKNKPSSANGSGSNNPIANITNAITNSKAFGKFVSGGKKLWTKFANSKAGQWASSKVKALMNTKVGSAVGNFLKAGAVKANEWTKRIYEKYKIADNNNAKSVCDDVTAHIHAVNEATDPNFYDGDSSKEEQTSTSTATPTSNPLDSASGGYAVNSGALGGPEGGNSGGDWRISKKINVSDIRRGAKQAAKKAGTGASSSDLEAPVREMKKASVKVKNSLITDKTSDMNSSIIEKLNILEEMHKENLRFHGVAEEFFSSALKMMAAIASSSGNSNISNKLSSMINEIAM